MTESDLDSWQRQFEEPDAVEPSGGREDDAPAGWASWRHWAADRWPSLGTGT